MEEAYHKLGQLEAECSEAVEEGECIAGGHRSALGIDSAEDSCEGNSHYYMGQQHRSASMLEEAELGLHMLARKAPCRNFEGAIHGSQSSQVHVRHSQLKGFSHHSSVGPVAHPDNRGKVFRKLVCHSNHVGHHRLWDRGLGCSSPGGMT